MLRVLAYVYFSRGQADNGDLLFARGFALHLGSLAALHLGILYLIFLFLLGLVLALHLNCGGDLGFASTIILRRTVVARRGLDLDDGQFSTVPLARGVCVFLKAFELYLTVTENFRLLVVGSVGSRVLSTWA